jgi:hypothetical protein
MKKTTNKKLMDMKTITINERTKAGKLLIETARLLARTNKGITIIEEKEENLLSQIEQGLMDVKRIQNKEIKGKSLNEMLNDK